jgi:beta-glucosidase
MVFMSFPRRSFLAGSAGAALAGLIHPKRAAAAPNASFPSGFVWGASTSAYQIEGAVREDGRGPSIWDTYAHTPGKIADGSTGDVACDHYHRFADDIDWVAKGGFNAYRFSIAWPRVFPGGEALNAKGPDFYDRVVDRLLAKHIEPWVCLYHWDLPQALQDRGGWLNRDTAAHFADYARAMGQKLGDRVGHWAMFNEPNIHAIFGHTIGGHAPGLTGWQNFAPSVHHQSLAAGLAIQALRAERQSLKLGTVMSLQPVHPCTESEADRNAAARFDAVWNRACLDPLMKGTLPDVLAKDFAPVMHDSDLATIHQPIDFLGINYYSRLHVRDDPNSALLGAGFGPIPGVSQFTAMGWPIEPDGLYEELVSFKTGYGNPELYVTENGAAFDDKPGVDGVIDDQDRIAFLKSHIDAAARALKDGVNLRGYFVWSLMDNFEWAEGFRRRFGLLHVDYATLERKPKASFNWLTQQIRA